MIDLVEGRALGLNASGSLVWEMLSSATEEEIASAVQARFGGRKDQVLSDVQHLLEELVGRGLIREAQEALENEPEATPQRHPSRGVLDVMRRLK
ncbi:MAG TPA: PqqD family protein [Thermoanaerobaculaceae bacterium]|nr:PqqD family protein [Thermoanaerobaculaceae bacterium]HRS16119.1 PqqD family protein [Thermoanaerobaculaceae bacterium]